QKVRPRVPPGDAGGKDRGASTQAAGHSTDLTVALKRSQAGLPPARSSFISRISGLVRLHHVGVETGQGTYHKVRGKERVQVTAGREPGHCRALVHRILG